MFQQLYEFTLRCSAHRHAPWYLGAIAFIESSFFPIPPDVMLISMGLAKPKSAWRNALIATFFSVLGGILGYFIGYFIFDLISPWLSQSSLYPSYQTALKWFEQYGVWAVIVAGFTPIPFKLFTIGAGVVHMFLPAFIMGSIIGRGLRFFLVSTLFYFYGEKIETTLVGIVDKIAWISLILFGLGYGIYHFFF